MTQAIKNKDNFKSVLSNYIPNLPKIDSISDVTSLDYPTVAFDLTIPDQMAVGSANITISNLKLT